MKDVIDITTRILDRELNEFKSAFLETLKNNPHASRDPTNNILPNLIQKQKQLTRKDLNIEQQAAIKGYYDYLEKVIELELSEINLRQLANPNPKSKTGTMSYVIKKAR
ncbi:MAG: hypothetical protein K0M69_17490 [Youngiibacter sp.]|nr:hypothetical protein [Youngiibacter sp.]